MLRLLLVLFVVAVPQSLRFPFLPACATQGAANVSAPSAPIGGSVQNVQQYMPVEVDAVLHLVDYDLHYVAVAPRRYVEMVYRALQSDLVGCFCHSYPPKWQMPLSGDDASGVAASLDMTGEVDSCSVTHLVVVSGFNDDPQQVVVNFTWSVVVPLPDGDRRPATIPPGTNLTLPNGCFTALQGVLNGLARRSKRRSLRNRTVYFGASPFSPTRKQSSGLFVEASFTNALFWLAVGVLVASGLMVLVTSLCTSWRASDGVEEELGPTGVANNIVIPDSTRYGPDNNRGGDAEGKEPGSSC
ncbi:hypothetical protein TRSC58_06243 [Trypanosoma rangeli SC58]|uniref:Transmembrane protein n=1 Tax=Trypanosoma rangeli SC58 TaxID=429131 RepID=A0A061IT12_TRYRA|nr:hypothetical protein TRSC58_06243 [Trypanosoma rangeli SC58]